MSYDEVSPETALLATMERHRLHVRRAFQTIIHELERRSLVHDESKYTAAELPGFVRINRVAREHPYGSEEYKASLRAEDCVHIHQRRNTHHPEYHTRAAILERSGYLAVEGDADLPGPPEAMGWLDIIEMVCDWWSATQTYGTTPWAEVLDRQRKRWEWSEAQWWLVEQVASWLVRGRS